MTERRCPNCEALITELDCLECVWFAQHQAAVRVMGQPFDPEGEVERARQLLAAMPIDPDYAQHRKAIA